MDYTCRERNPNSDVPHKYVIFLDRLILMARVKANRCLRTFRSKQLQPLRISASFGDSQCQCSNKSFSALASAFRQQQKRPLNCDARYFCFVIIIIIIIAAPTKGMDGNGGKCFSCKNNNFNTKFRYSIIRPAAIDG